MMSVRFLCLRKFGNIEVSGTGMVNVTFGLILVDNEKIVIVMW